MTPTLIVVSEVKWRYMRTRKQYLLAAWPGGWRILFLEPIAFGRPNRFTVERDGDVRYVTVPFLKAGTTSKPYERLLASPAGRAAAEAAAWVWTRAALAQLGPGRAEERALFVSNVLAWPQVAGVGRRVAVYDMNDDPLGFHDGAAWMTSYARRTLAETDLVVACSTGLARRAQANGAREVTVIGNGANVAQFAEPQPEPEALRHLPHPRIGYIGAIAPWFDFDLVERVARAHPTTPVVLVGPAQKTVTEKLAAVRQRCANVTYIGEVPHTDVAAHAQALDVCLIPFVRGPLTDVLNPNKLYEYFAAGRSVVSLDYSDDMRAVGDALFLASDADGFVAATSRALEAPRDAASLRALAQQHSWAAKAAQYAATLTARAGW